MQTKILRDVWRKYTKRFLTYLCANAQSMTSRNFTVSL